MASHQSNLVVYINRALDQYIGSLYVSVALNLARMKCIMLVGLCANWAKFLASTWFECIAIIYTPQPIFSSCGGGRGIKKYSRTLISAIFMLFDLI